MIEGAGRRFLGRQTSGPRRARAPARRWHEVRVGVAARRRAPTRRASMNRRRMRRHRHPRGAVHTEIERPRRGQRDGALRQMSGADWLGRRRVCVAGISRRQDSVDGRGGDPDRLRRRLGRLRSARDLDWRGFGRRGRRRRWLSLRLRLWLLPSSAAARKERPDRVGLLRSGVGHHDRRRIANHIGWRTVGAKARQQLRIVRSLHRRRSHIVDLHVRRAHGLHVEDVGDARGYVHHPTGVIGAAIVDAHDDRIAVARGWSPEHSSAAALSDERPRARPCRRPRRWRCGGRGTPRRTRRPCRSPYRRGSRRGNIVCPRPYKGGRPDIALRRAARLRHRRQPSGWRGRIWTERNARGRGNRTRAGPREARSRQAPRPPRRGSWRLAISDCPHSCAVQGPKRSSRLLGSRTSARFELQTPSPPQRQNISEPSSPLRTIDPASFRIR